MDVSYSIQDNQKKKKIISFPMFVLDQMDLV